LALTETKKPFAQLWCMGGPVPLSSGRMKVRDAMLVAFLGAASGPAAWAQDLGGGTGTNAAPPEETPPVVSYSPVILAENPDVVQRFAINPAEARGMVDREILKLTSAPDLGTAWRRLGVTADDIVGIKITTTGGPLLSSHWPVVQAICDGLQEAGLPPSHIIIWDKLARDMIAAGYTPEPGTATRPTFAAIFPGTGYDPNVIYKSNVIGTLVWGDADFVARDPGTDLLSAARTAVDAKGYGDGSTTPGTGLSENGDGMQTSSKSYYAKLVSRICTKLINVPVLTDNSYVGINGCLASLALGSVDNTRRFEGEPSFGDPAICDILRADFFRRKVILHVLDALVAEYAGGPVFNPQFTEPIGALYVSRDPVAIDSLVLPRLERWRKQNRIDPIGRRASHIAEAASYNLGTDDPSRIQLVKIP
jgi:hypothetical protein